MNNLLKLNKEYYIMWIKKIYILVLSLVRGVNLKEIKLFYFRLV